VADPNQRADSVDYRVMSLAMSHLHLFGAISLPTGAYACVGVAARKVLAAPSRSGSLARTANSCERSRMRATNRNQLQMAERVSFELKTDHI
jgi:hypothetical protein